MRMCVRVCVCVSIEHCTPCTAPLFCCCSLFLSPCVPPLHGSANSNYHPPPLHHPLRRIPEPRTLSPSRCCLSSTFSRDLPSAAQPPGRPATYWYSSHASTPAQCKVCVCVCARVCVRVCVCVCMCVCLCTIVIRKGAKQAPPLLESPSTTPRVSPPPTIDPVHESSPFLITWLAHSPSRPSSSCSTSLSARPNSSSPQGGCSNGTSRHRRACTGGSSACTPARACAMPCTQ